ncbi:MAG: histone deacetylase [Acidobacteriota bacterium]|nr:histone deacetylase [Blastocatellia bacterium]MDW8413537.1 histone deacetylase [Acidobacteriota bacterium]
MKTVIVYDHRYTEHETSSLYGVHPERPERVSLIANHLKSNELDLLWLLPKQAERSDVLRCHTSMLFDLVERACQTGIEYLDPDTAICKHSFDVALLAAGGVLTAIDSVVGGNRNAFVIVRPPGHHATAERSQGFCLFNNVAIGARYAQHRHGLERVLIVDWDVHHGNGTQDIFYTDDSVFYLSLHQYPHYPGTGSRTEEGDGRGRGYTLNVPLRAGTSATDYRSAFERALSQAVNKLHPDLVLISAGFDSHKDDPLGNLLLDDADFAWMTNQLKAVAEKYAAGRLVSVLEGGYNLKKLPATVAEHVKALCD